jgi:hypothetical protein
MASSSTTTTTGAPGSDIYNARSVAELRAAIAQLNARDAAVTARLDSLVASQRSLSRELGRLDVARARLSAQVLPRARALSHGDGVSNVSGGTSPNTATTTLADAAATAQRLASRVRRLDVEQARVRATLAVVEQVAELKACVLGVAGCMGAPQDWEAAAAYVARAARIAPRIAGGAFAARVVPTAAVPDAPRDTLAHAAAALGGLFEREFARAAQAGDGARVTRFFKLFPLVGRADVGLDVYGRYVCAGVAARARANLAGADLGVGAAGEGAGAGAGGGQRKDGFFYAGALTKLFEHVAQIVDGHSALVEQYYGAGSMVRVIERLQHEVDLQGGIIIDTWADERNVDRLLSDIRAYAFSFLVQSFLPQHRPNGMARSAFSGAGDSSGAQRGSAEEDSVDMKAVDSLLNELTIMLGRWSLYCRFLAIKCSVSLPSLYYNVSSFSHC